MPPRPACFTRTACRRQWGEVAALLGQVAGFETLEVPVEDLGRLSFLHFALGSLPEENLDALREAVGENVVLVPLATAGGERRLVAVTSRKGRFALQTALENGGFERKAIEEGQQGSLAEVINDPRLYTNLDSLLIIWSDLSKKINEGRGNLAAVVNDSSLYQNMKKLLDTAAALLAQMNKGHGDLGRLMNSKGELYAHTDSTLASLNRLLDRINQGEGTLGQLASDAELYKKITATLQSLDSLIIDIRENPKRYVKFSLF